MVNSKKKILFFMWSFSLGGGAEKILASIVNHLDTNRYDVDILEMEHFDKGYENVPDGVRILPAYKKRSYGRFMDALLWRARIYFPNFVRRRLIKDKYDVEVSFTIMNPAFPFSKRENVQKIAWIHGSIEAFLLPEQQNYRDNHRKQLAQANDIVAISKKTRESIEAVYPEFTDKITTIYNGYDFQGILDKAQESVSELIEEDSICVIGRLEAQKGTDRVLEVFRQLHEIHPKAHLYYIGSGEQEELLKQQVSKAKLERFVHFLGYQKNPYKYLQKMKVLLSLSKQEGFSGAFVEAVTLGKPFVATDVGGAYELSAGNKYGKIIHTNQEAISALMQYLTKQQQIASDYSEFIQSFTIDKQMQAIQKLLEDVPERR